MPVANAAPLLGAVDRRRDHPPVTVGVEVAPAASGATVETASPAGVAFSSRANCSANSSGARWPAPMRGPTHRTTRDQARWAKRNRRRRFRGHRRFEGAQRANGGAQGEQRARAGRPSDRWCRRRLRSHHRCLLAARTLPHVAPTHSGSGVLARIRNIWAWHLGGVTRCPRKPPVTQRLRNWRRVLLGCTSRSTRGRYPVGSRSCQPSPDVRKRTSLQVRTAASGDIKFVLIRALPAILQRSPAAAAAQSGCAPKTSSPGPKPSCLPPCRRGRAFARTSGRRLDRAVDKIDQAAHRIRSGGARRLPDPRREALGRDERQPAADERARRAAIGA